MSVDQYVLFRVYEISNLSIIYILLKANKLVVSGHEEV